MIQNQWNPATTGAGFELTPILQPLAKVRDQINVLSGLSHLQADTFGDGTGDHPRASAVWLTGVHAYDRTQPGVEVRLATTVDQLAAQRDRQERRAFRRSSSSVDFPTQGACDSGDCFYVNTVSWRNATTPNPTESHPRIVFERLFGDGGSAAARQARTRSRGQHPRFGAATRRAASRAASAPATRAKLGEYLESVREVEQRIQHSETQPARDRAARAADRHSRQLRRAHQADVRPAGAGLPGRHHARLQHDHVARAELAHLRDASACPSSTTPCRITATTRS